MVMGIIVATFYFETSSNMTKPGLNQPREELETQPPQQSLLQPIYEDDSIGYSLQNDQLRITFNKGEDWVTVPVEKGKLFAGEYNGDEQELIDKSYILSENRA